MKSLLLVSALGVCFSTLLTPRTCSADDSSELAIAVDLESVAGVEADEVGDEVTEDEVASGWGSGVRVGKEWSLAVFYLRPELGMHYYDFSGDGGPNFLQPSAGLRFGLDFLVKAGIFAHAGVSHIDELAVTYDTGVELGLALIPYVDLGLHLAFEFVNPRGAAEFDFVKLGANAGLRF